MDDFERILPIELLGSATRTPSGAELLFPYPEVKRAIKEASANRIAVLGVEVFRILDEGLGVETYSGYGFDDLPLNWSDYVDKNNQAALGFVAEHAYVGQYRYILTAASESESRGLRAFHLGKDAPSA